MNTAALPRLRRTENTPGVRGYLVAGAASVSICTALLVLPPMTTVEGFSALGVLILYGPMIGVVCGFLALPVILVGGLFVHLTCQRVTAQTVHVLAAGAAGLVIGGGYWLVLLSGERWDVGWGLWVPVLIAVAAAVGRAAVIPLVGIL